MTTSPRSRHPGLRWIAVFKLLKGLLLVVLAIGALHLLHRDVQQTMEDWINTLRFDPDNRYIAAVLDKAGLVDDHKLKQLGALTFVYAGIFLTEGLGLWLEKRWAEWLTVVATGSFVPVEIYESAKHFSWIKILLLLVNLAVVAFLISILRRKEAEERSPDRKRRTSPAATASPH